MSLIFTPVLRFLMICSDVRLQAELRKMFLIQLMKAIPTTSLRKQLPVTSTTSHTVKKRPAYLHLPSLATPSVRHESKIKVSVEKCFFAAEQGDIFTSRPLLSAIKKDLFPVLLLSNVLIVYNFWDHCDNRYVGRTSQRL